MPLKFLFLEKKSSHLKLFLFSFAHLSDCKLFLSQKKISSLTSQCNLNICYWREVSHNKTSCHMYCISSHFTPGCTKTSVVLDELLALRTLFTCFLLPNVPQNIKILCLQQVPNFFWECTSFVELHIRYRLSENMYI
jgi:hypothetical protein